MKTRTIEQEKDLSIVIDLLKANKLPHQDLRLHDSLFVTYADENNQLIAVGGMEFYSHHALLRSVAVDQAKQRGGYGKRVVDDLLRRAKERGVRNVYLLTETARDFFLKKGFIDVPRDQVPAEVKNSSEFTSVCPVSAACMVYHLD